MSCNDVASVLDTHRTTRLAPAERARIDAHLAACADCSAAWHAQSELVALRVPPMPSTLLERALLASRLPQSAPARRARMPIVIGSVLLAGAAAAAVTIVSMTREQSAPIVSPATGERSATAPDATADESVTQVEGARPATSDDGVTSVELVETALGIQPVIRKNPDYPPSALKQGLDGHVQLKFDVTAAGIVENVSIVESSDAQFEEPAVRALSEWRYLPRIAAGKRVASNGVHSIIRFVLQKDPEPAKPLSDEAAEAAMREWAAFNSDLEVAMDRLAADDLRGVELQLDEMQAIYGAERADLWSFHGYLYTVQGNYDRAIDAYERSLAAYTRANQARSVPSVALANLYYARHQYDMALKTLLRPNAAGGNILPNPDAEALAQKLKALGVTEETL
jgi:TonB family protein